MTFAEKVIRFNKNLHYEGVLPEDIRIMNPFRENKEVLSISALFYRKFYNDNKKRKLILGINPGRLGAGTTGIPFTDTKRLSSICDIHIEGFKTHEPSSVFVYDLISRYGGAQKFYSDYFIHSICPLGFICKNKNGNWVNCNYYDFPVLANAVRPFMIKSLQQIRSFGIDDSICFVLGRKNAGYVEEINKEIKAFDTIETFEHPRYIEQYKSKERDAYLKKFLERLKKGS